MWRTCAALTAAITLGAGCAPELNWREVRTGAMGVAQLFPCKPVRQQRALRLAGRDVTMVLHVCDADGVSWAQSYADVGDPAAVGAALQALVDGAHANLGSTRTVAGPAAVAGASPHAASGRYRLQGRSPADRREVSAALLVFAHGTVVVQVTAIGSRPAAAAVDAFLGSVRIAA